MTDAFDSSNVLWDTHTPFVSLDGFGGATVSSNVYHPTVASSDAATVHFIDRLIVLDQDNAVVALVDVKAGESASFFFLVPVGTTAITPYVHCNREGLFKGATVTLATEATWPGAQPACALRTCEDAGENGRRLTGAMAGAAPRATRPHAPCSARLPPAGSSSARVPRARLCASRERGDRACRRPTGACRTRLTR